MARGTAGQIAFGGLTPLLDTLFILLFALLALSESRTSHAQEQIHVRLPEVEPSDDSGYSSQRSIVLEVDSDSTLRLAQDASVLASREELDRALAAFLGDAIGEEVVVEIRADRNSRHGVTVELLQHLRIRGFVKVDMIAVGGSEPGALFGGQR